MRWEMGLNRTEVGPGPMAAPDWDKETLPPFCDVQHGAVEGAPGPPEQAPRLPSGGAYNPSLGGWIGKWDCSSWGKGGIGNRLYSRSRPFNLWRLFFLFAHVSLSSGLGFFFLQVTTQDWTLRSIFEDFSTFFHFRVTLTSLFTAWIQ